MANDGEVNQSSTAAQSPKRGHEQEDQSRSETYRSSRNPSEVPSDSASASASRPIGNTPLLTTDSPPPLPAEDIPPPLPSEALPGSEPEDDGWEPVWDDKLQAYYFFNKIAGTTQWENPRVLDKTAESETRKRPHGGYDPAIHGNYDPNASYAVEAREQEKVTSSEATGGSAAAEPDYSAAGHFNRFTGKWQAEALRAENYSDEAKSKRQMNAFFDVDAAANSHHGKSLKAERANKKLSKHELKAFKEKRKEKKEEKRRAWLRD